MEPLTTSNISTCLEILDNGVCCSRSMNPVGASATEDRSEGGPEARKVTVGIGTDKRIPRDSWSSASSSPASHCGPVAAMATILGVGLVMEVLSWVNSCEDRPTFPKDSAIEPNSVRSRITDLIY